MAAERDNRLVPLGRVRRGAPIVGLATRAAVGRLSASLRRRLGNDAAILEFHQENALRIAERLSGSRGLLMKAGQLLSFVQPGEALPPASWTPYQDALAALRDDIDPIPGPVVRAVLETELGTPPEEAFSEFEDVPFAAASLGQVHAARLSTGDRVAVKVQYPGVAEAIRHDLANVELLATLFKLARSTMPRLPRVDVDALAAELGARITEELDYRRERQNLEDFAGWYADEPLIHIPRTYPELCTGGVLTMELAEGIRWADALRAPQDLRDQWGFAINRFFFRSLYRYSAFHADPHPGNYLFHDDGAVTVVDFGCVSTLDDIALDGYVTIVTATVRGDAEELARAFRVHGFIADDGPSPRDILEFWQPTFQLLLADQPFRMTPEIAADWIENLSPIGREPRVSRQFNIPAPFLLTTRIFVGLFAVMGALGAQADWRAEYERNLEDYRARRLGPPQ